MNRRDLLKLALGGVAALVSRRLPTITLPPVTPYESAFDKLIHDTPTRAMVRDDIDAVMSDGWLAQLNEACGRGSLMILDNLGIHLEFSETHKALDDRARDIGLRGWWELPDGEYKDVFMTQALNAMEGDDGRA